MKRVLTITLILFSINLQSQINPDTNINIDPSGDDLLATKELEFRKEFGLENANVINAKTLDACELRMKPDPESDKTGFIIQAGEFIEIYKYYATERCWATKYKGNWGFVSDTKVFPVSEKVVPSKVSKYDEPPQLKTTISPKYPKEAKKKGIKGKVFIKVYIDETGKATEAIILDGLSELNQAAIDAVLKAKYLPAKLDNKDVGVWVNLSINF